MKIRLVGGPFAGKVMHGDGRNDLIVCGPKRETRKQEYERVMRQHDSLGYYPYGKPTVEARYRIAMRHQGISSHVVYAPCMHPDGSIFYEYVKDSKRERP